MRRRELIEFHEQPWFPEQLRHTVTSLLQFLLTRLQYHHEVAPLLATAMRRMRATRVVDLCSGSGGPWLELAPLLKTSQPLTICLTDKFPNYYSIPRLNHSCKTAKLSFWSEPVDAACVPQTLPGFRTIFNSFHHFDPATAARVLQDAVSQHEGIAVFEVPRRNTLTITATVLMALGTLVFLPFVEPFRISTFFWTYIIPLIPLVMWFDGAVSCMRSYTLSELRQMASATCAAGYTWRAGTVNAVRFRLPVTYLIGVPTAVADSREQLDCHADRVADPVRAETDRIASTAASSSSSVL